MRRAKKEKELNPNLGALRSGSTLTPPPPKLRTGLNVALLSRTESKLTAAASEIEAKYNVQTKVVAVDFGAATAADYGRIAGVVGDLDVAVLVNNVGMSYDHAEYYDAIDDKLIDDLIAINIQATNKVSYSFFSFFFFSPSPLCLTLDDDLFSNNNKTLLSLPSLPSSFR